MDARVPYHCAVFVDDIAQSTLGDSLGLWEEAYDLPPIDVCQYDGVRPLDGRARAVRCNPEFTVTIESSSNIAAMRPEPFNRWHHVGYPTTAIVHEVRAMEAIGFRKQAWHPDDALQVSFFAYMLAPNGLRIELTQLEPGYLPQVKEDYAARVAKDLATGMDSKLAYGRRVAHMAATVDDPVAVAKDLENALGLTWGDPTDIAFQVDGREPEVFREITALGEPGIRLLSGLPVSVGRGIGWQYAALITDDLEHETATLVKRGYLLEARSRRDGEGSAVLLTAPEQTRIMLVEEAR